MFQKCPVCNGTGNINTIGIYQKCDVCNGRKIISEITGLPPSPPQSENLSVADQIKEKLKDYYE